MLSDFISLIYPQNCSGCDALLVQSEKGICSSCLIELEKLSIQRPITSFHFGRKEIEKFISGFHLIKGGVLLNIIHNIKYNNNKASANVLGVELGKKLKELCIVDKIELTRIFKDYNGDAYFPEIPTEKFKLVNEETHELEGIENIRYSFLTYIKK